MGLIDETRNIGKELENANNIKHEKEGTSQINARLENDLQTVILEELLQHDLNYVIEFYNIEKRNAIILRIGDSQLEHNKLNKIYDKVLKRASKIYKQHIEYKNWNLYDRLNSN